jgi:uncharacterized protein (DUF433 family)
MALYELSEASRYLFATAPERPPHYVTVWRWARSGLAGQRERPVSGGLITFEELVSLRMVTALRLAGFSTQHVRQVHAWLKESTGYPRPFALRDLWVSETQVFVDMEQRLISATREGQYAMEFIRGWLRKLRRPYDGFGEMEFANVEGHDVALLWRSHPHVVMRPSIQFGSPCVEGTRVPTRSIWLMRLGGDSETLISRAYGLTSEQTKAALEWEQLLAEAA